MPAHKSLSASVVLVLLLGFTGPQLSGVVGSVRASLSPLVHFYRGLAAANAGDLNAASGWLRKAVVDAPTNTPAAPSPEPVGPFFLAPGDCEDRPPRPIPEPPPATPACPCT